MKLLKRLVYPIYKWKFKCTFVETYTRGIVFGVQVGYNYEKRKENNRALTLNHNRQVEVQVEEIMNRKNF